MVIKIKLFVTPRKEQFDKQVIDSAFKGIIAENMMTHLVFAGNYYSDSYRLESLIFEIMKKNEMNRLMVTTINMYRKDLISKEAMDILLSKKKKVLGYSSLLKEAAKESVTDDFDSFFEDLRLGKTPKRSVNTYFLPKLTKKELKLVETKDKDFMATFFSQMDPGIERTEMQSPESESKFVHGLGQRQTYMIDKEELPKESINDDLDSLFEDLRLGKNPEERVNTYFLPKLTEEEIDNGIQVRGYAERRTFTIQNSKDSCFLQ